MRLPDGILALVKRDCPTCQLVEPVLGQLAAAGPLTVYSQDDPAFPAGIADVVDDRALTVSRFLELVAVPTLVKVRDGVEVGRAEGWLRPAWEELTGVEGLGVQLPEHRPG